MALIGRGVGSLVGDKNNDCPDWLSCRGKWCLSRSRSGRRPLSLKLASFEGDGRVFRLLGGIGVPEMSALAFAFCLAMGSGECERVEKGDAKKAWVLEADVGEE